MVEQAVPTAYPPCDVTSSRAHIADFRHLVEGRGWQHLHPSIITRFNDMAEGTYTHHYTGNMVVTRSCLGIVFSCLCKCFGSPLVRHQADSVNVEVAVIPQKDGICWQRVFHFENIPFITVSSLKIVDVKHGLMERVGGGLHMKLRVYEEEGNLHFVSNSYYLKTGRFFIPLPSLLTPGRLHVAHIDEGEGAFRFRMSFDHRYFGRVFYQDGVFKEYRK